MMRIEVLHADVCLSGVCYSIKPIVRFREKRNLSKNRILGKKIRRLLTSAAVVLAVSSAAGAQIVVTAPVGGNSTNRVKAAPDYATEVLYDRWDMNERTDLGWRIFNTVEEPKSYLTNISFSSGIFSATSQQLPGGNVGDSDANISILDSAYWGASDIGKFGVNYKIDASKYTVFAVRMSVNPPINAWPTGQLFWSRNTIYPAAPGGGSSQSNPFWIYGGWAIYLIDLPTLGLLQGNDSWSGMLDSLRFDPVVQADKNIQIDWIRLVQDGADYRRTITWTGSGSVDIYLDNDNNPLNGNLGLLAKNQTGGSYTFLAGGLAAGTYYVAIAPAGTTNYAYSSGYYTVTEQPIIRITKPSDEGSDQDFMTVVAGNPWDFDSLSDVDWTVNVHDQSIQTITYQDLAGQTFTNNSVFYGVSDTTTGIGDPEVFFLNSAFRGSTYKIDTSRYHNLVCKMGIAGVHSTNDGSIARVMYMRTDEHSIGENVSQDIVIRHTLLPGGTWVMDKFVADLRTLPLEAGAGSPSHSGWTGTMDSFRIDPHEFSLARAFFFDDVKITSDWQTDTSFAIEWTFQDADTPSGATLALYYDTNPSGYNGTLIRSGIAVVPGPGSFAWNTTGVPGGIYYIYAVVSDPDLNQNKCYATGPVIVSHTGTPAISLSKSSLVFGSVVNGISSSPVNVVLSNTGTGTLSWSAAKNASWITVSPTSGTGNAVLQIGANPSGLAVGKHQGTISITDPNATNSPQTISVTLNIIGTGLSAPPFGDYSTPLDGTTGIAGAIPVTGWALDDIEVTGVTIYRNPVAGEPTQANGLVSIGDAVFVEGARPDVEAAYPNYPFNDRAGWGYMMLTNFLPNQGNGTFKIYAYATDSEGNTVLLGMKTITCSNAAAVKPFGTIDTPAQGGDASGNAYVNFGWVLTPKPNTVPIDGSTISVWVDGVQAGVLNDAPNAYDQYRSDIATDFPGLNNSAGPVGFSYLDTTAFTNGVHTIYWIATDNAGNADGIGSRYFNIVNTGTTASQSTQTDQSIGVKGLDSYNSVMNLPVSFEPQRVKKGFDIKAEPELYKPAEYGVIFLDLREVERVEVDLKAMAPEVSTGGGSCAYSGFLVVGNQLRPLPVGSTLDQRKATFTWLPGPGFLGPYQFVFLRKNQAGVQRKIQVNVRVIPKYVIK